MRNSTNLFITTQKLFSSEASGVVNKHKKNTLLEKFSPKPKFSGYLCMLIKFHKFGKFPSNFFYKTVTSKLFCGFYGNIMGFSSFNSIFSIFQYLVQKHEKYKECKICEICKVPTVPKVCKYYLKNCSKCE